jgi:hypothetical protein
MDLLLYKNLRCPLMLNVVIILLSTSYKILSNIFLSCLCPHMGINIVVRHNRPTTAGFEVLTAVLMNVAISGI